MKEKVVKLGLKQNKTQFILLVLVNAFVGAMVGLERTILPQLAEENFHIDSHSAVLSFIVAFGIAKAIANYYTGKLANIWGRKKLLVWGWLLAIPVPLLLIYASSWTWVIAANILLGISQGLTWSSTVVMKIDLVGPKNRGFAMGINEFAGYFAVGLVALITGFIASNYGVTPYPFYLGIFISIVGLILSIIWVKDTRAHVHLETETTSKFPEFRNVFMATTFKHHTLSAVTQAGLVNNLNDGMIWGLLPILLLNENYNLDSIGWLTAIYPAVWGIGQLFTGKMADNFNKKRMLFWGMFVQGLAIIFIPSSSMFWLLAFFMVVLGFGTALVYPTFLTTIAAFTHPNQRAESVGVFRLWRDLGYAFGAVISGIIADAFGIDLAIISIGLLTVFSSLIIQIRMPN